LLVGRCSDDLSDLPRDRDDLIRHPWAIVPRAVKTKSQGRISGILALFSAKQGDILAFYRFRSILV
jgi:hypothetical protein